MVFYRNTRIYMATDRINRFMYVLFSSNYIAGANVKIKQVRTKMQQNTLGLKRKPK